MSSEGWEWLKEQPSNWEAPDKLQSPTASVALNLGVQLIGSSIIGNDLVEVVGEFIVAKARLELWMGRLDPPLPLRKQFEIGRATTEAVRILYDAWLEYEKAHRSAGGKVLKIEEERLALLAAAREAVAILASPLR